MEKYSDFVPEAAILQGAHESTARDQLEQCRQRGAAAIAAAKLGSGPPGGTPDLTPNLEALLHPAPQLTDHDLTPN